MKAFIGRGGELIGPLDAGVNRYVQGFRSAGVKVYVLEKAELMEFLLQWLAEQRGYRTEGHPLLHLWPPLQAFCVHWCTNRLRGIRRLEARR